MDDLSRVNDDHIAAFRRFNRFHSQLLGSLNELVLASNFTLAQARVLYEIGNAPKGQPPAARDLAEALKLDSGYLSRMLAKLEKMGMIQRETGPDNAKLILLTMTPHGVEVLAGLEAAATNHVRGLLQPLHDNQRRQVIGAMERLRRLLGDRRDTGPLIVLRDPGPGDLGWIVRRQGMLYTEEYGWDWTFEGEVAQIVGDYARDHQPGRERCWVAEREGDIVGSVFVVRQDDQTAALRLLYVDPAARGLGLGRQLVDECLRFARSAGYRRLVLSTHDVLVPARRIFDAAGFTLIDETPHRSFGQNLVGQTFARDL